MSLKKEIEMTKDERSELFYQVKRHIAQRDADRLKAANPEGNYEPDEYPYIQEGDVKDVVTAFEELGYKLVKA